MVKIRFQIVELRLLILGFCARVIHTLYRFVRIKVSFPHFLGKIVRLLRILYYI